MLRITVIYKIKNSPIKRIAYIYKANLEYFTQKLISVGGELIEVKGA